MNVTGLTIFQGDKIQALADCVDFYKEATGEEPEAIYLGARHHRIKSVFGYPVKIDPFLFDKFRVGSSNQRESPFKEFYLN